MVRLGLAHRSGNLSGSGGGGGGAKQQVTSDPGLALHYLSLAARRGNAEADYEIANTLFWGVESKDALVKYGRQAYVHARRAAEDGWTAAFLLVGMAYEDGVGVEKSERTAANWYLQGCSKGDEFARKKYDHLVYRGVEAFRKH
jgi:TPR repeat protein